MHKCRTKGLQQLSFIAQHTDLVWRSAVLNVSASSTNDIICTTTKIYILQKEKNASDKEKN